MSSLDQRYSKGVPKFAGYEYSPDIPSQMVMGSPGGVSAIHHHWSHGLYSYAGGTKGIHGGDLPRYPSGVYGNIYDGGVSSMDAYGMAHPEMENLTANMTTGNIRENYTKDDPLTTKINLDGMGINIDHKKEMGFKNILYILLLSILLAVTYFYWAHGLNEYISQYMKMNANSKIFMAIVGTLIICIIISIFGI